MIGVDISPSIVETINDGRIHIVEPELDGIVRKAVDDGKLRATLTPEPADAFIVAVPTPFKAGHQPDLSSIKAAAEMISSVLKPGDLVILESTSPVGATEQMAGWLADVRPDLSFPQDAGEDADIQIAYCPERVLPGHVVRELVQNDRVIGGMTETASRLATLLYKKIVEGECIITDSRTAEMCKLTENSARDVQIAFANELSTICDKFDINVWELISLANRHPRVEILQPGAGVGGHCIAVDPWFIVSSAPDDAKLIKTARQQNDAKPKWVLDKGMAAIDAVLNQEPQRTLSDIKVACLGLAFKPNIDDLRHSPAMEIVQAFGDVGCEVLAVEPHINELPTELTEKPISLTSLDEALRTSDIVCILVKHTAFEDIDDRLNEKSIVIDVVGLTTYRPAKNETVSKPRPRPVVELQRT